MLCAPSWTAAIHLLPRCNFQSRTVHTEPVLAAGCWKQYSSLDGVEWTCLAFFMNKGRDLDILPVESTCFKFVFFPSGVGIPATHTLLPVDRLGQALAGGVMCTLPLGNIADSPVPPAVIG